MTRRHTTKLCENPRTGTIYVREKNPDSRTLEWQRTPRGEVRFGIERRYRAGWKPAETFDSRTDARAAWRVRSRHWAARMVAYAEGLTCKIRPRAPA